MHELLIDVDNLRTRYLDVRLSKELAATPGERDVLVPIGTANVVDDQKIVRVPLTAERFGLLPLYDHGHLSRVHEVEVRRHFSLGEAAAATATGAVAGATAGAAQREFYDNEGYDDQRFFGERRAPYTEVPGLHRTSDRAAAERPVTDRELADRELAAREKKQEFAPPEVRDADRRSLIARSPIAPSARARARSACPSSATRAWCSSEARGDVMRSSSVGRSSRETNGCDLQRELRLLSKGV